MQYTPEEFEDLKHGADAVVAQRDARIAELEKALQAFLDVRDWCVQAGGTKGPLPQDVIEKFAEMQQRAVDDARALMTRAE